jgi:hypothetical protein
MPWLGVGLYLALFFLFMHLVDRLGARSPEAGDDDQGDE